jgi:hypothetical protein
MIVTHPHRRHVEAAAFVIKAPEKGACGPVTKSGDLEMIDRALAGPVHPGQSAGQISQWPILHRRSILRAASTQGNATALRRDGENLAAALSTGYKTAANIVPSDKAEALPHPRQIPDRIEQNARGLHPLESWRVLVSYATRIRAEVALVSDAAGSRT